jgi:hypothetical protein
MNWELEQLLAARPALSDESVVEIRDFLHTFVLAFESYYGAQILRYDDDRFTAHLAHAQLPIPFELDDSPF